MKRALLLFGLTVASIGRGAAADEPVVAMSPFEVSANSVDFKSWIKVGSPHYIVYTDASEKEAGVVLRELEELRVVAQVFFRRTAQNLPPMIVVLPTSHSDWRKLESKGSVEWRVAVSQPGDRLQELVLVQYDWQSEGLNIMRSAQASAMLSALNLDGPFWFARGIGSFFETLEITSNGVTLGQQNLRTLALDRNGWLDWPVFFRITSTSPEFRREGTVQRVDGQAALFVHYLLTSATPGWSERLMDWSARTRSGREPSEAEFQGVFAQDWKTWQGTMREYLEHGRFRVLTYPIGKKSFDFATTKYDLPVREMRELFVIAQVLNQRLPASEAALDSVLARGLQFESLRELLAEACFQHGRAAAGLEQLRTLLRGRSADPRVAGLLAEKLFIESVPQHSLHAQLDAETVTEIRALCRQALELEPRFVPAIDLLAWTEALGPKVGAENLAAIEHYYQTLNGYASTSDAVAAMGVAAWRSGELPWARRIAQALADSPYADEDGRRIAGELLLELGEPPAPAAGAK